MMERIDRWLEPLARRLDIDDARWLRLRRRTAAVLIAIGLGLGLLNALIYSPVFLIDALYHSREMGLHALARLPDDKRAKATQRLCWVYMYYSRGSEKDPYAIPGIEACGTDSSLTAPPRP
jgi:hypothetical protein